MTEASKPLAVIGAGGHGFVVAEAAGLAGSWAGIAFFDDGIPAGSEVGQWRVCGSLAALWETLAHDPDAYEVVVAIGRNDVRESLIHKLLAMRVSLATVVHPQAWISPSATLDAATVVLAGATINSRVRIGVGCIVNVGCSVDHDGRIDDFAHLAPGVVLAGGASVGRSAWLGTGTLLAPGCRVAAHTVTAPGTVVA